MRQRCSCSDCGCLDDATRDDTLCSACKRSCKTESCENCGRSSCLTRKQAADGKTCKECNAKAV